MKPFAEIKAAENKVTEENAVGRRPRGSGYICLKSRKKTPAGYKFPKEKEVPAGTFVGTIDKVKISTSSSGNPAWDFCYTLEDDNQSSYKLKQRVPQEGFYSDRFLNQLADAGVAEETLVPEIADFPVTVDITYDDDGIPIFSLHPIDVEEAE